MAEHILQTRIQLRYGTYTQWMNSDVILKIGEAAIASFPRNQVLENLSNSEPDNTPPAIGIKIGDGHHYFSELPWVQAIAADVYNWAKSSAKPVYTANEIQGLQNFVENIAGVGGGNNVVPRIYQLVAGTGEYENQYFLRYTEDNENWIIDNSTSIDLNDLVTVVNWIGRSFLEDYPNLTTRNATQIRAFLATLAYSDTARPNQFVTSVTEENGIITVERSQVAFSNLSGYASVPQGGTGRTNLPEDQVLVGNENNAVKTIPIATEIAANNNLVPNYLIKAYVDNAVAGLEGAMHFVGDAATSPLTSASAGIQGYVPVAGDVVLWEQKEYVWTGGGWRLLGDEGSYAVKGSIRDADIDAEANIQQSKIYNLSETLSGKVDKEQGKGLSSNDYTNEDKTKLDGIQAGAQVNTIEHIFLNDTEAVPHEANNMLNVVELNVKEFDDESRAKLATIEEGANVNVIDGISLNGTAQTPDNNGVVNLVINEMSAEDKLKLDNIEAYAQVNLIEHLYLNGTEVHPDQNKRIDLYLSEITPEQAEKLAGIEFGAQVNVIERIIMDGTEVYPDQNKIVTLQSNPAHENVIERIKINNIEQLPDNNKTVNITLDQAALNLDVISGAQIPAQNRANLEDVTEIQKKLQFERIAVTGDVKDLLQTNDTYIILNCGSSTDVI